MPAGKTNTFGHPVASLLGLAYVSIVETSFPELVVCFADFSP